MVTYNLINSIKGGCGKTAFSIWMAYYLKNSLLIDMDLLGTSMQIIFDGNTHTCKSAYTNDIFKGVKKGKKDFVEKIEMATGRYINVVFANMDPWERENFKSGRHSGYIPAVKHSIFRLGLKELVKNNKVIDNEPVEHFIFDMPPNSDGFSDAAMECVFNPKYSEVKREDRKNLFMMIGVDWGQTIATINELKYLLLVNDEKEPDRIFLVINHNLESNFGVKSYRIRKYEIENALARCGLNEGLKEKIFFLTLSNNKNYTELIIGESGGGKGLRNASADEISNAFPKAVISAFAEYGKEFIDILDVEDGQEKLQNLILGR